jgi:hypothetical protein
VSKSTVTRLFIGAAVAVVLGWVVAIVALVGALVGGVVTLGGPAVVTVDGAGLAGTLAWLVIAALAIGGGAVTAIVSWVGALFNTAQLEDKTWFLALLVLGLVSFGWVAMAAYVWAGPDATRPTAGRPAVATTPGT